MTLHLRSCVLGTVLGMVAMERQIALRSSVRPYPE